MIKVLLLIPLFFFLAVIQTSFLIHVTIFGVVINLVLITFILINLLRATRLTLGLPSAVIAGFFLDAFSGTFFGFWVIILIIASFIIEAVMNRYVRSPIF